MKKISDKALRLIAAAGVLAMLACLFLPSIQINHLSLGVRQSTARISLFSLALGYMHVPDAGYKDIFNTAKQAVPGVMITSSVLYLYPSSALPGKILFGLIVALSAGALLAMFASKKRRIGWPLALMCAALVVFIAFTLSYISIGTAATNIKGFAFGVGPGFVLGVAAMTVGICAFALTDRQIYRQRYLMAMLAPFAVWLFIFAYLPMFGWILAFKSYTPSDSIFLLKFLDPLWRNFTDFLNSPDFGLVMRNTLVLNLLFILLLTPTAVLLAVMLSEVRIKSFRKAVQTVSYLPHFISWVVVASIVQTFFSLDGGIVNTLLMNLGIIKSPVGFMQEAKYFPALITFVQLWKSVGWESIIYLAAITSISPDLYEAAMIDGASRGQRIWKITLPSILPIIGIIVIMNTGWILSGFDPYFLIGNSTNRDWSIVMDTYTFQMGIGMLRYGYATAVGVFKTVLGLILLVGANFLGKRLADIELLK
jgi:putative aldouronate transport system permease protein